MFGRGPNDNTNGKINGNRIGTKIDNESTSDLNPSEFDDNPYRRGFGNGPNGLRSESRSLGHCGRTDSIKMECSRNLGGTTGTTVSSLSVPLNNNGNNTVLSTMTSMSNNPQCPKGNMKGAPNGSVPLNMNGMNTMNGMRRHPHCNGLGHGVRAHPHSQHAVHQCSGKHHGQRPCQHHHLRGHHVRGPHGNMMRDHHPRHYHNAVQSQHPSTMTSISSLSSSSQSQSQPQQSTAPLFMSSNRSVNSTLTRKSAPSSVFRVSSSGISSQNKNVSNPFMARNDGDDRSTVHSVIALAPNVTKDSGHNNGNGASSVSINGLNGARNGINGSEDKTSSLIGKRKRNENAPISTDFSQPPSLKKFRK